MKLTVIPTSLPEVLILEPELFEDGRGFFYESFNAVDFEQATGRTARFVQDNHSMSVGHTVRGLHYQLRCPQAKLVRALAGEIFDVAVDVRPDSPHFGKWAGAVLSAANRRQLWIPEGFAHGFAVLSDRAEVLYKVTDHWHAGDERCIAWDDPAVGIEWPLAGEVILSERDRTGVLLARAELPYSAGLML